MLAGCRTKLLASAIASSMASLVPDPMEKCAVCAESPMSTTLPASVRQCQDLLRTKGKSSQIDLFDISRWLPSSSANSSWQNGIDSCSDIVSRPARRHVSGRVSTMKVLVYSSNGYACTWNRPCSVSLKTNVNASNTRSVPNQTYLQPWGSTVVTQSPPRRTVLFDPSVE